MVSRAQVIRHDKAAPLFPVLAADPENNIFLLDDRSIAFGFLCHPLSGADPSIADRIKAMLNDDWPPDTILQFTLFSTGNVSRQIAEMRLQRWTQKDPLLVAAMQKRAEFLTNGTLGYIEPSTRTKLRDFRLVVSCIIPIAESQPSEKEIGRAERLQVSFHKGLENIRLFPTAMTRDLYVETMSTLLNQDRNAAWRDGITAVAEDDRLLNQQLLDYTTAIHPDARGLRLGETHVRMLSAKRLPKGIYQGFAASYLGDVMTGSRGLKENFMLTFSIVFPDRQATKAALEQKRAWVTRQAYGPMLKFVPTLAARKKGFDVLFEALENGDRPVQVSFALALFADTEEEATSAASNARTYYSELQLQVMDDRYLCLPLFLNALPFGADRKAIRDLMRYKTMAVRHVVPLLPLYGDWKGTGSASMQFVTRNGQIMNSCLWDSDSNFNLAICAESGSGKSFATNYILESYLSQDAQAWVIDVGRSYENICETYDGDFVSFEANSKLCLNPFPLVKDWDDEADVLVGVVAAMATPTEKLSDFQLTGLKRIMKELWDEQGSSMEVATISERLIGEDDKRLQDIGHQLYPFAKGEYSKFFSGPNNVNFKNRLTVLELQELKGRKHLQRVVLFLLMYQIQQAMYLGDKARKKIVIIDEAWELLAGGESGDEAIAKFIETGYRRARKENGCFVVVTQSVLDLYQNKTGEAIATNSANMYLLGQKSEVIDRLKEEKKLGLSGFGYDWLKTVHTSKGAYSEIFFITKRGSGIGRLIVNQFSQILFSTDPRDRAALKKYRDARLSIEASINEVINERGKRVA